MKHRIAVLLLSLFAILVVSVPAIQGFPGGRGSGTEEYDCGGSCHTNPSSATITMWSPSLAIDPGDTVNITVNVSGGQQTIGQPLGVMIVSALDTTSSLPSDAGWTILSDPGGLTAYNYYETSSYTGSVTWVWELTAPSTPGPHILYARAMHGGGQAYAVDDITGLTLQVNTVQVPEFGFLMPTSALIAAMVIIGGRAFKRA